MDDIKASFQKYDVDKSGSITLDEAYLVLQVRFIFIWGLHKFFEAITQLQRPHVLMANWCSELCKVHFVQSLGKLHVSPLNRLKPRIFLLILPLWILPFLIPPPLINSYAHSSRLSFYVVGWVGLQSRSDSADDRDLRSELRQQTQLRGVHLVLLENTGKVRTSFEFLKLKHVIELLNVTRNYLLSF